MDGASATATAPSSRRSSCRRSFGFDQGWRVDKHPRFLADITGDGRADIVGFGDAGVWTALSNGDGSFQPAQFVQAEFGFDQGWRVDKHPRFLADITGDGRADIVGFGDAGVWTALSNGDGSFQAAQFVLADLGFEGGAGGSRSTPACWPTSPATARPTSSASATRGCSWR